MTEKNQPGTSSLPTAPAAVTLVVDRLFCASQTARCGPYQRLDTGVELLPGSLYRYAMLDASQVPVSLQIFTGLGRIGGQLWEQEVRVLLRISAIGHPALPRIIDGSYDDESDVAFVTTERSEYDLAAPDAMPFLRERPAECVRHLSLLADALAVLHGQGLMHRNLWPGSIDVVEEGAGSGKLRLRLARFEMSALVGNFLRRVSPAEDYADDEVRRLFLRQGPRALAYCPPERLAFLFPSASSDMLETDRSDVYGLGVIASEWFIGPLPTELFAGELSDSSSPPAWSESLRGKLLAEITRSKVPARLQDLLRGMLDPDPRTRLTSSQVVEEITRRYDAFVAPWETDAGDQNYLVAFMPVESRETVRRWEWIDHDPAEPEGRAELAQFLEADLRGAVLVYSADGADPYVLGGDQAAKRQARYVLLGQRGAWFCVPYQDRSPFGRAGETLHEILLVKYVARRDKTRRLDALPFQRRVSCAEAVPFDVGRAALDERRRGRPSWTPLLDAVRIDVPKPEWQTTFEEAFEWFLDQQEVELRAREYPFVRVSDSGGSTHVRLRYDRARDENRIHRHRTALFALFASNPSRRPSFGDFFDAADPEDEEGTSLLQFCPDEEGRAEWTLRGDAFIGRRLDEDHIEVKRTPGSPSVPERGWLRPKKDFGTYRALERQRSARPEFLEARALLAQLHAPSAIKGFRHRWRDAGQGLRGGADGIVKDMLVSQAFYALHGPPGTGKTTVAAHAVEAFLRAERGARVLVSAQSNYALDNLALRIRKRITAEGLDILAIRVASPSGEEKVDPRLDDLRLDNLVPRLVARIVAEAGQRLERRTDPEQVRVILGRWKAALETSHLEIQDRIRRGANLVFATCSAATKRNVDAVGSFGVYDWVIIEEAAKAWPTELAIPLVRGVRWTLIGDHHQLPAHRRREVEDLLAECAEADDPDLRRHGEARAHYAKVFDLFGSLFRDHGPKSASRGSALTAPLGRLKLQFRMRAPIAEVVSRAFYPHPDGPGPDRVPRGTLETDPTTEADHGLRAPAGLGGQALVWLDTKGIADCADEPRWSNEGEVRIVEELLRQMRPEPNGRGKHDGHVDPLAILSPYRDQIRLLERAALPDGCRSQLFTVHEFQGREADIVVASLVRDKVRGTTAPANLGHLGSAELVNVLLSRARRLLVIVGRYDHFRSSGVEFWQTVCDTVERKGVIRGAEALLGRGGRA
jgi:hypothetical protein